MYIINLSMPVSQGEFPHKSHSGAVSILYYFITILQHHSPLTLKAVSALSEIWTLQQSEKWRHVH